MSTHTSAPGKAPAIWHCRPTTSQPEFSSETYRSRSCPESAARCAESSLTEFDARRKCLRSPGARPTMRCVPSKWVQAVVDWLRYSALGMVVIRLVRPVMVVIVVLVNNVWIGWSADNSMLVLDRPGVHVDVESGGGHIVAHRIFNAHGESMGILKRRFRIGGDVHDGDQLAPYPAHPHIVNFEHACD